MENQPDNTEKTYDDLTPKQKIFVEEYLKSFNATQAAKNAGYSEKSAKYMGHETLTKPYLKKIIDQRIQERLDNLNEEALQTIEETKKIAFASKAKLLKKKRKKVKGKSTYEWECPDKIDPSLIEDVYLDDKGRITGYKLHSKLKALENLGKYAGIHRTIAEVSGKDGGNIPVELKITNNFLPDPNSDVGDDDSTS